MSKISDAQKILESFGLPKNQQNEISALTLLALCGLTETDKWKSSKKHKLSVVGNKNNPKYEGIMRFIAKNYNKNYAENSRETIRRKVLHQFVQAGIVEHNPDNPELATNSKDNHYCLTDEVLKVIISFGTKKWDTELRLYLDKSETLKDKYYQKRNFRKVPITLSDGTKLELSPGKHNQLQISVIKEFAERFAPGSLLLYLGDTGIKDLFVNKEYFEQLNIKFDKHCKLPDIVLYDKEKNWIYLIEVVTSHGPISPKRLIELKALIPAQIGLIFVSAFPDFKELKKHINDIAWDTEVWINEFPEHLIHFNGDKFFGPR